MREVRIQVVCDYDITETCARTEDGRISEERSICVEIQAIVRQSNTRDSIEILSEVYKSGLGSVIFFQNGATSRTKVQD